MNTNVTLPADFKAPEKYVLRAVRPTAVTPKIDGKITVEEWGDTPDFRLDHDFTEGKRTYCLDHFYGAGEHIAAMDLYWRYDDRYVYFALKLREPKTYTSPVPITATGTSSALTVHFGDACFRLVPENGKIETALGNMHYAYTYEDGAYCFEFAALRDVVTGGGTAFLGCTEYHVSVQYIRLNPNGDRPSGASQVVTRTTPIYADETFTHDVFVLAEGTPAPAPEEKMEYNVSYDPHMEDVKLKDGLTLRFGDPIVIEQGPVGDQIWGHYQFPSINRMLDGSLRASWSYSRDTIEYKDEVTPSGITHSISHDEGKTWEYGGKYTDCRVKNLMPNGKYFVGFRGKGAYKTDYLDKYTPGVTWNGFKMFFAEDVEETEDKTVTAYEYDPKTGEKTAFECTVNWKYMPIVQWPNKLVYPVTQIFALSGGTVTTVDGVLYMPLYFYGFDEAAKTREDAVAPWSRVYSLYFCKSEDCGRTWDMLAQIPAAGTVTDFSEGPCEPEMTIAPDGSFVMMFRTGGCNPCYITRSTDRGVTWSAPARFDEIGVLPQILTLKCGVTLASYGRPTMRFAATDDPAAMKWEKPFDFPVCGGANQSCFYTDLFPVEDNKALFIYSDFMYPNKNGAPARAILVRTVTVITD